MSLDPEVSFILPTRDRREVLYGVLERIQRLPLSLPWEAVVVDNASSDGTVEGLRRFPQVRVVRSERNLGAAARNLGAEAARGAYLCMLDDDSYPLPGAVEGALRAFASPGGGDLGCVALEVRHPGGGGEAAGLFTAFTGCGAVLPRALFLALGGYPEAYGYYVEEYDLSFRIWARGLRVANIRGLACVHLRAGANRDFGRILYLLVRNNILLWRRFLEPPEADRQLRMELWRYAAIARKEGVPEAWERGRREGEMAAAALRPHPLAPEVAATVLCRPWIETAARAAARAHPRGRAVVLGLGKVAHLVVEALQDQGLEVPAVVDANPAMAGTSPEGFRVCLPEGLEALAPDCLVSGSASIREDPLLRGLRRSHPWYPFAFTQVPDDGSGEVRRC